VTFHNSRGFVFRGPLHNLEMCNIWRGSLLLYMRSGRYMCQLPNPRIFRWFVLAGCIEADLTSKYQRSGILRDLRDLHVCLHRSKHKVSKNNSQNLGIKDDQGWSRIVYMFIIFTKFIVSCHLLPRQVCWNILGISMFFRFSDKGYHKVERWLSKSVDLCRNWLTLPRNFGRVMLRLREL